VNPLKLAAIGAEIAVVSTLAVSSYHVAFGGPNPNWLPGARIVKVVAFETMRLPLAFELPRLRLLGTVGCLALRQALRVERLLTGGGPCSTIVTHVE
jgi:hypothetical protein